METNSNFIPESRGMIKNPEKKLTSLSPKSNMKSGGWEPAITQHEQP